MLSHELQQLGLGSHEAKVYGALLAYAPAGASHIAKACGLSRSSVYTTLASLTAKGLVATSYKNEVKQFVPTGAEAVERHLAHERDAAIARLNAFASIKQHLDLAAAGDHHIPKVMLFEGVEGLQRIYLAMLRDAREGTTMYVLRDEFIWRDVWAFSREPEWRDRVRRWKSSKGMRSRVLINDSTIERSKTAYYATREHTDVRYLPKRCALKDFALYVVGDTMAIMSFETGNLIGIQITNASIAENFTHTFDALWDQSKQ